MLPHKPTPLDVLKAKKPHRKAEVPALPSAKGRIDAETKTGHVEVKTPLKYTADRLANFFRVFDLDVTVNCPAPVGDWVVRATGTEWRLTAAMGTFQRYGDIIMGDDDDS